MTSNPRLKASTSAANAPNGFGLVQLLIVIAILGLLVAFLLPATRSARPAAHRSHCKNNLKQIAIALHNYHDQYGGLPPAYTVDAEGNRLHSWRTLILPFMDQKPLYAKIDLTKAWDDPVNAEACKSTVWAYRCPSANGPETHTTYLAIVSSNSCFRATESRRLSDVIDGEANTLMVIETDLDHAVHWMSPMDADVSLLLAFGGSSRLAHTGGIHVGMVNGNVRFMNATIPTDVLRAVISIDGKEDLNSW